MKARKKEIILIYNSEKKQDRTAMAYAASVGGYQLNEKDLSKNTLTSTQIVEIANDLGLQVLDLVDKQSDYYINEVKSTDLSNEEVLKLMTLHPEMIKTPIAMMNDEIFLVKSSYDFVNIGLGFTSDESKSGNIYESDKD